MLSIQQLKHLKWGAMWFFFLKTAYDQLWRLPTLFFSVQLEWCARCWNVCILVLCWLTDLFEDKSTLCSSLQGITFAFHMHLKWVGFFVLFLVFFNLEFIIIHFKLQIIFLRPFDNFEILLLSSCRKSFHYGCEMMLRCKISGIKPSEQWNFDC